MIGRSVLVGVDGSPEATDAAVLGRRLSRAAGGKLHLVGAVAEFGLEVAAIRSRLAVDRLRERLLASRREQVCDELATEFDRDELEESLSMEVGRSEHVIARAGEAFGADVFVLGGHRRASPTGRLRRSTARHLLRAADRPVLVTGPDRGLFERLVACVDLSFASEAVLRLAGEVATLLALPVEVVHVVQSPTVPGALGQALDASALAQDARAQAEQELQRLELEDTGVHILEGDVVPTIGDFVSEGPPALLVLGAQGRGWVDRLLLGSTTEALLNELPTSLAIIPVPKTGS